MFVETPSPTGLPTKANRDPFSHEMRLSPFGHQPSIFWSREVFIIILIFIIIIILFLFILIFIIIFIIFQFYYYYYYYYYYYFFIWLRTICFLNHNVFSFSNTSWSRLEYAWGTKNYYTKSILKTSWRLTRFAGTLHKIQNVCGCFTVNWNHETWNYLLRVLL